MLTVAPDHREVEHGDGHVLAGATGRAEVPVEHLELVLEHGGVGRQVAGVCEAGRNVERASFAAASHDHRDLVGGTRVRRGLGQAHAVPGVRLRAGRPERPAGLDGALQEVESLPGRWEGHPVGRVLAVPPPRADAEERATSGQGVQGGGGLGGHARRPEGDGRAQRAQLQLGVQARHEAERHPGLRNGLPRAVDLRDLDEMVHQGEPREARLGRGQGHRAHPRAGILTPPESRQLEHHTKSVRGGRLRGLSPIRGIGSIQAAVCRQSATCPRG